MEHSPPATAPAAEETESDRAPQSSPHSGLAAAPAPLRPEQRQSGSLGVERQLLRRLLERLGNPPVALSLWDGREVAAGNGVPQVRLRVADRATLWRLAVNPLLQFGEAYSDGTL